jgi:hypothetical protein
MQHGAPALPQKLVCPHSAPQRKCYQRVKGTSGITCSGSRWTHLTPLTEHCTKLSLPTACHHHLLIITALVLLYSCQASYPGPPPPPPRAPSESLQHAPSDLPKCAPPASHRLCKRDARPAQHREASWRVCMCVQHEASSPQPRMRTHTCMCAVCRLAHREAALHTRTH